MRPSWAPVCIAVARHAWPGWRPGTPMTVNEPPSMPPPDQLAATLSFVPERQASVAPDQQSPCESVHFCGSVPPILRRAVSRLARLPAGNAPVPAGCVTITRSVAGSPCSVAASEAKLSVGCTPCVP